MDGQFRVEDVDMTNTSPPSVPSDTTQAEPGREPDLDDPRPALDAVVAEVGRLIAGTTTDQLTGPTPCPDFTVKELTEHLILVLWRIAAIGRGDHWSSVTEEAIDSGWHEDYLAAATDLRSVWNRPAMLDGVYEVPWGTLPAAPVLLSYVAEVAVHGWDLATATGQSISLDDQVIAPALGVVQFGLPADGRVGTDMPFDPVVDPGADAPVLLRLAGWLGRKVA